MKHIQKLRKLILTFGILAGMGMTAYAAMDQNKTFKAGDMIHSGFPMEWIRFGDENNTRKQVDDCTIQSITYNETSGKWVVSISTPSWEDPLSLSYPSQTGKVFVGLKWASTSDDPVTNGYYQLAAVYEDAPTVAVIGVTLNKTSATLAVGGTETLTATVSPDGATNKTVTWSSDNTSVATVDANGKVTAASAGTATITVTATNGTNDTSDDKQATCTVTVTAEQPVTVAAKADPSTTGTYYATFYDSTKSYTADCEVYYATANADGRLTLQKAEGNVIKAGEGVILKATGENVTLTKTTTEANYDSLLTGSDRETTVENALVLSHGKNGVWFYKYSGTLGANKAYLAQ